MTKRQDFYSFRMLIQELEQKNSQYEMLGQKLKAPTASVITSMPKNQNRSNRLDYFLHKRTELSKKIDGLKVRISEEKADLEAAMEDLKVTERTVLECRYFLLFSWEEITAILFEPLEDFKEKYEEYVQKTRLIQTMAFKNILKGKEK